MPTTATAPTPERDRRLALAPDVTERLSISRGTVYNLINRGDLKTVTVGARRFVRESDLSTYIRGLR